jgi:hypothetical protein
MLIGMVHSDYTAERLARIQALLDDATRKKIAMKRPRPALARELAASLDAMLKELRAGSDQSDFRPSFVTARLR